MKRLLNSKAVCEILDVKPATLSRMVHSNRIPYVLLGTVRPVSARLCLGLPSLSKLNNASRKMMARYGSMTDMSGEPSIQLGA
jgi:hypothetical protein